MSALPIPEPEPEEPAGSGLPGDGGGPDGAWEDEPEGPRQGLFLVIPGGGDLTLHGFCHDGRADKMKPGPLLAELLGVIAGDNGAGLKTVPNDGLCGFVSGVARMESWHAWARMSMLVEISSRPESRGLAADQVAGMLCLSWQQVAAEISYSNRVVHRLPQCFAALRDGQLRPFDIKIIEEATRFLPEELVATADALLARAAIGMTTGELRAYASALALKLDPEGAKKRKEEARQETRFRAWREDSGNAAISGRELPTVEALAASQAVGIRAKELRAAGVPGTLEELKVRAFLDLLQSRDSRLTLDLTDPAPDRDLDSGNGRDSDHGNDGRDGSAPADEPAGFGPAYDEPAGRDLPDDDPGASETPRMEPWDFQLDLPGEEPPDGRIWDDPGDGDPGDSDPGGGSGPDGPGGSGGSGGPGGGGPGGGRGGRGPGSGSPGSGSRIAGTGPVLAGLVNITVPYTIWHGDTGPPGQVGGFGIVDHHDTRDAIAAAARSPDSRWCITLLDPGGTAAAHGCAPGPRHWPAGPPAPGSFSELYRMLNIKTLDEVIRGPCDHAQEEHRYRPSRKLQHLVRARNAICTAPGCNFRASVCDIDHTRTYDSGGRTCPCNLAPLCRHHHRTKHTEGWHLEQPQPGILVWRTPANRTYTTQPTIYPH